MLDDMQQELVALHEHGRSQIKEFLSRLNEQKEAQTQGVPRSKRRETVPAFTMPTEYDPHADTSKWKKHAGEITRKWIHTIHYPGRVTNPSKWNSEQALLLETDRENDFTICSNTSLIDFGNGPLAETEAGDWTP